MKHKMLEMNKHFEKPALYPGRFFVSMSLYFLIIA
jgi:hypothetical protein